MSEDHIPTSADGYAPLLPNDPALAGAVVDTADKRFLAAREAAFASKLTQGEFSILLGVEGARAMRAAGRKAPPANPRHVVPATEIPRREPPPRPYSEMSMTEKLKRFGHV
jgi:hypothetical protein